MAHKGINLNSMEDRALMQRKGEFWRTWGVPGVRLPFTSKEEPDDSDYIPTNFNP